eukprot:3659815-Prymnesium_polylepis.1
MDHGRGTQVAVPLRGANRACHLELRCLRLRSLLITRETSGLGRAPSVSPVPVGFTDFTAP